MSRLLPGALTVAGIVLVTAGTAIGLHQPPASPADAGIVPVAAPVTAPVTAPATVRAGDDGTSARGAHRRVEPPSPPVAVRLPHRAAARVVPVSTSRSGTLDPPARVDVVGWWRGGAAIGEPGGSVVLVGHVDALGQGEGTFAALWSARPGDRVQVRTAAGHEVRYRVTGLRSYSRREPLPASVFASGAGARLVMITCAGRFDTRTGHYSESLVVYAVPAGPA